MIKNTKEKLGANKRTRFAYKAAWSRSYLQREESKNSRNNKIRSLR